MPLPRFRIRTLMIAVAVVGTVFAVGAELARRRARFLALANYHGRQAEPFRTYYAWPPPAVLREFSLEEKYRAAARRPWLPVPPDPPEPK